jgi:isoquinoline 1-oxidoreductase beta subunit
VVASSWWLAQQAALAAQPSWQPGPDGKLDSARIDRALEAAAKGEDGTTFHERGDVAQASQQAARKLEAVYRAPYLAHATLEPMNCTAIVKDGRVEVWAPTQVPGMARAMAAKVAGVDVDQVTLHVTLLGGGFGRRLEVDFVGQAVRVAMD